MSTPVWIAVGSVGVFVALNIFWRYGARVSHAPCPAWLAWMLTMNPSDRAGRPGGVVDQLGLQPGMRVADIGCGPGRLTVPIAMRVEATGEVVALDMQEAMLRLLDKRVTAAGVTNVRKIHGGAGDGLLPKDHFDRAILVTVLGEIPDRERALREILGALKPGGFLLIQELFGDPHYQFKKKVRTLGESAGFRVGEVVDGWISYTMRLYRP